MKQLLSLVFLLSCLSSFAQEPVYTPMRLNYQFRGIKTDSLFLVPSYTDTAQANGYTVKNIGGALIRTGSDFWMRNGTATAWLQNVNVGPGASPTVQFVDSVWRVVGKDSIFWRKGSVTNKIKDSTGKPDSPDRINGTATNNVSAAMATYDFRVTNATDIQLAANNNSELTASRVVFISGSDSVRISSNTKIDIGLPNRRLTIEGVNLQYKDFNNTFLQIDTLGNFSAGDLTKDSLIFTINKTNERVTIKSKSPSVWREPVSGLTSQIKTAYYNAGIDLSAGNDTAFVPGTYIIDNGDTNVFFLPDATKYGGQTVYVIIRDDAPSGTISALSGSVYQPDETTYPLKSNSFNTLTSDGTDWWGGYIQY